MATPQPPQQPLVSAPVTLLDIYTRQVEMGAQLAVIGEQLKQLPDHEQRIRVLEASRARLAGACVAVGAVAGGAAGWVALVLTHR
jgi:hypothetical protein